MAENKLDAVFEIDRSGAFIRSISIAGLKNPVEDNTDAEGITWMYGDRYAIVMEGAEEMAIVNITPQTTALQRNQALILDMSGDPKGVAYQASDDTLLWVSQADPMRVVKARLNEAAGTLDTIWNKNVENLPSVGLADVAVFPKLSPHIFLISQDSRVIMEVDMTGQTAVLKSSFSLAGWPIPRAGGVAFGSDGSFRVVGKHLADQPEDDFSVFVPTAPFSNLPPFAFAGSDIEAIDFDGTGAPADIDASLSNDPDGAIIQYQWLVNGVVVNSGFHPKVKRLLHRFAVGVSTVSLVVRDDSQAVSQVTLRVLARPFAPGEQLADPHPQPAGVPPVSTNFIHPGSTVRLAEFFLNIRETGSGEIRIYDQVGREVKTIRTAVFSPGQYRAPWDLRNEDGTEISSGVYFVLVKTPGETRKEKLVVVR